MFPAWFLYYLSRVRRLRLHLGRGSNPGSSKSTREAFLRLKGIVDRCPSLSSRYWPTWYAHPRDLQFLLLGFKEFRARLLQRRPYTRQVLRLNDGAPIALDWVPATHTHQDDGLQPYPVCVLLHGMAQDSSSATMIDLLMCV